MAIFKKAIQCAKCRREVSGVLPVNGGVCENCLVKNVPLEDALASICACLHVKVIEIYKQYKRHAS